MTYEASPPPPARSGDLRGYAICTEQRSGSSYLCQLLVSSGVLGRPLEYFNGPGMARLQPGYPQDAEGQLHAITTQGATENGIYGVKLFSSNFDDPALAGWPKRLPGLHFISLTRSDLLGQAISLTRLAQTDQYSADATAVGNPVYDRARIALELHKFAWKQARWAAFFARCGIAPLHLDYDEISADPQITVEKVAHFMGLDSVPRVDLGLVHTRVQRDALSEEWRARFVAEAGDLSFLDRPLPEGYRDRAIRLLGQVARRVKNRRYPIPE